MNNIWHKKLTDLDLKYQYPNWQKDWQWLLYKGSLTKFMRNIAMPEDLVIDLISQNWRIADDYEKNRLNLKNNFNINFNVFNILERKILMSVINQPWMFARSYFNYEAVDFFGDDLRNLGNKSLGDLIFKYYIDDYDIYNKSSMVGITGITSIISRTEFEYSYIDLDFIKNNHNYIELKKYITQNNILNNKLIARRSLYYLNSMECPLFNLEEIFLPDFINKILNLEVNIKKIINAI